MNFKKAVSVVALTVALVAGGISTSFAQLANSVLYTNSEKKFSISFPKDWEQKPGAGGSIIAALSPIEGTNDQFRENVNVVSEDLPKAMSSEEYYQAGLNSLKTLPSFNQLQKGTMTVNGQPVVWIIATHKSSNVDAEMIQYYYVQGNRAYILTGTGLQSTFNNYKSKFDEIAKTFKAL